MIKSKRQGNRSNRPRSEVRRLPHIKKQELYIAYIDGEAVAAFWLLWRDEAFWGDREARDSIYLHTFATKREHSGRGIGNTVIQWVANFGREHKRKRLRLDCFHSNKSLISFYERSGFTSVGYIIKDGRALTFMEQPI